MTSRADTGSLRGDDDGTSLIELVVGMALMTVFMGMFTGAVVAMNRAENKTEAVSVTATQLNQAFLTLDRTVRYAAALSTPGRPTATSDWYVEARTTNGGSQVCTQLRVDITAKALQRRTWKVVAGATSELSPWSQVASNISNGTAAVNSSDQPFVARANSQVQQLTVNLVSLSGSGPTVTTSRSSFGFNATNSTIPAPTGPVCQEVGRP